MALAPAVASPVLPQVDRSHLTVILVIALVARVATLLVYAHQNPLADLHHWGYENIIIALSLESGGGFLHHPSVSLQDQRRSWHQGIRFYRGADTSVWHGAYHRVGAPSLTFWCHW